MILVMHHIMCEPMFHCLWYNKYCTKSKSICYEQFSTNKCLNVYGMILMILYKAMCLPSRNMSGPHQPGKHVFPERGPTGNRSLFLGRSVAHKLCRDASELRRSMLPGVYPAQGVERYVVLRHVILCTTLKLLTHSVRPFKSSTRGPLHVSSLACKTCKITRGHDFMLVKGQNRLDFRKYSFSQRTVNEWNKLSADCVHSSSVNMFKNRIDNYLVRAGYT